MQGTGDLAPNNLNDVRQAGISGLPRRSVAKAGVSACSRTLSELRGSNRREFPFDLREPYKVARCVDCGFHYLYPHLIESAMQEVYRESSYYEGGACGYADTSYTAQEFALRATFRRFLHNLAKRGLTGGDLLEIGCRHARLVHPAHV